MYHSRSNTCTLFLRSDAVTADFFLSLCGYYLRMAFILWKHCEHHQWLDKVHTSEMVMIAKTLSVVCAAFHSSCQPWETTPTAWIALVLVWWPLIVGTCVGVPRPLAVATIWGQRLFKWRNTVCHFVYLLKYSCTCAASYQCHLSMNSQWTTSP